MSALLTLSQIKQVAIGIARRLDDMQIDYAIMGGAAVCLLSGVNNRTTEDVDLVIHVDERMITADTLTTRLQELYPDNFGSVTQYGHSILAYRLVDGNDSRLVQLEVFDYHTWPQMPQYDLQRASRRTLNVNNGEYSVKVFSPEWILREKTLSQFQRQGSLKEQSDIYDLTAMLPLVEPGKPELEFDREDNDPQLAEALANLLEKRSALRPQLRRKIRCSAVFGHE